MQFYTYKLEFFILNRFNTVNLLPATLLVILRFKMNESFPGLGRESHHLIHLYNPQHSAVITPPRLNFASLNKRGRSFRNFDLFFFVMGKMLKGEKGLGNQHSYSCVVVFLIFHFTQSQLHIKLKTFFCFPALFYCLSLFFLYLGYKISKEG